ncbi:site-specific integrase [Fusobacterium nucleatum]|uniref:tyrosine-type recombinase/integrase n=1 Tax=Fusobacterium nucleatum TaxID=851 RepID=UPI0030D05E69
MSAEKEKIKGEYTGRWNARFTIKLLNNKTKRVFKRGFKNKKEALEYEKETILNNTLGASIPFKNAVNQYLEFKKPRLKESTYINLECLLKKITFFDNLLMSEITPIQVSSFQNELIKIYKSSTIKNINTQIKMLFTWCVRYKGLTNNPFNMVDRLKLETKKRMDIITVDEFNKIIEQVDKPDMKLMFKILFWTGLRLGEARALKIDDIDFKNKSISVTKTYTELKEKDIITTPKTKESIRTIKIDDVLTQEIKDYLDKARYILNNDFIFCYTKPYYLEIFKRIALRVLGKRLRIHDLRHSHASFLINNGVDVLLISKRLGHSNTAMTLNVYSHLYSDKENKAIDIINKLKKE